MPRSSATVAYVSLSTHATPNSPKRRPRPRLRRSDAEIAGDLPSSSAPPRPRRPARRDRGELLAVSPSLFSSSHAVATAPSSTAPAAAGARRRRGPGNQTARASCPTCSPPRVVAVGAMNALPRPLQPRSHKHPNASAAPSSFAASSVRPRCCRMPLWMRASPSSPRVPSSARLGAGEAIPSPSAVSATASG